MGLNGVAVLRCQRVRSTWVRRAGRPTFTRRDNAIVFVTYAREDWDFVVRLRAALATQGVEVRGDWLLPAGEHYRAQLEQLIIGSDALIFVMSPDSVASQACIEELRFANEQKKRLLPIVYRKVADEPIPAPLFDPQWIFLNENTLSAGIARLIEAINTDFDLLPEFRRLAIAAESWARTKQREDLLHASTLISAQRWLEAVAARTGKLPQPTPLIDEYIATSKADHIRRRNWLFAIAGAGMVALAIVAYEASNLSDFIHSLFVSSTIDRVIARDPDLRKKLGAPRGQEFYCNYFQAFAGGRIFYLSETKAWVFPGQRSRQAGRSSTNAIHPYCSGLMKTATLLAELPSSTAKTSRASMYS